MPQIIKIW